MSCPITTHSANIADLLLDVVFLVDAQGILVDVSAGCEQLLGYRPDEMAGRRMLDFVAEEDRARTIEEAARVASGTERIGFENRYRRKDGSLVDIMWSARSIGSDGLRIGVARDITTRKQAERRQSALYAISEAAHRSPDLPTLCAEIHAILDELVGVAGMAVVTDDAGSTRVVYLDDDGPDRPAVRCLEGWRSASLPEGWLALELRGQGGVIGGLLLHARAAPYPAPERELLHFVAGQVGMALERKRLHEELLRHACHDELTGLPNRYLFFDRIHLALARAQRTGSRFGILYVDVDDFKEVNDRHGHAAGDILLREVAARLLGCARQSDTVARLGGDEFVMILEELSAAEDIERIARQIGAAVQGPVRVAGAELRIGASIGIARFPEDGEQIDTLLKHADLCMYSQKRERKSCRGERAAGVQRA
jgi:diguanylate cyclase (GGDEF)-like protein/PAS domain S-box-containing protein